MISLTGIPDKTYSIGRVFLYRAAMLIVVLLQCATSQHRFLLSGMVENTDKEHLPYATIRVQGSSLGTICNVFGRFQLELPDSSLVLKVSYLGYAASVLPVQPGKDTNITVTLFPSDVQLPEVVVIGEDPAYSIIREAILRKNLIRKKITAYKARMYTKDTFGRDTVLGMISEAYSDLYWSINDSAKEVVVYRRQSSNLPKEFQFSLVRNFINFNDDSVYLWGYTFVAPLADSAFALYDYRLKRTTIDRHSRYFDIEIIPKRQTLPLFSGIMTIADSSFTLQSVKLIPNSIFHLPVISFAAFEISQRFSLYNDRFWFPLDYRIDAKLKLQYLMVDLPSVLFYNKSVICYEYDPEYIIDETIRAKPALTMLPTAQSYDTSQWTNAKLFPLTPLESASYGLIDEKMKRIPAWLKVMMNPQDYQKTIELIDLRYNRTEGVFAGINFPYYVDSSLRINTKVGYGFSDHRVKWSVEPEYSIGYGFTFKGSLYRRIETFPVNYSGALPWNSFSSFFNGEDYYHYYERAGGEISLSHSVKHFGVFSTGFVNERQSSLTKNTEFSVAFIGNKKSFSPNVSIQDGVLRSFLFEFQGGSEVRPSYFFIEPADQWNVRFEYSSPKIGSLFRFTSLFSRFFVRIPTMGTMMLFYPYIELAGSGGWSTGDVPVQRSFAFEAPLSRVVTPYSFRTVRPNEFTGDNFYTFSCEYNLREIPLFALGITGVHIDLILKVATGNIMTHSARLIPVTNPLSVNYTEYTVGLGRVADIFRFDFSLSQGKHRRFNITLLGSI